MHPLLVKKNIFQAQRVFLYAEMLLHLVAPVLQPRNHVLNNLGNGFFFRKHKK